MLHCLNTCMYIYIYIFDFHHSSIYSGNGVVLHLPTLFKELETNKAKGVSHFVIRPLY